MKKLILLSTVVFMAILIWGCAKDNNNTTVLKARLAGNWQWELSSGGFAGVTITPQSCKCTERLEIRADGSGARYRNDTIIQSFLYELKESSCMGYDNSMVFRQTDSSYIGTFCFKFSADNRLEGSWDCSDCFYERFVK